MQLQCDFMYVMRFCKSNLFFPVRNQNIIPLVLQDLGKIIRPGAGNPVGCLVLRRAAGATGECIYNRNTKLFCQQDRIGQILIEFLCNCFIRMYCIPVCTQCTDLQTIFVNCVQKLFLLVFISQKLCRIAVCRSREAAASDLHHLYALLRQKFTCRIQGHIAQSNRQYS